LRNRLRSAPRPVPGLVSVHAGRELYLAPSGARDGDRAGVPSRKPIVNAVDVSVGIVFGALAGSNLVQGAWLEYYPWLNLTTAAFVLALPISLAALRRPTSISGVLLTLLLTFALAVGYLAPALSASAGEKRINLGVGVAFVFIASYLSLTNPRRLKSFIVTLICLAIPVIVGQVLVPDPLALSTGRRTPVGLNAIGASRAVSSALILTLTMIVIPWKAKRRLPLVLLALVLAISIYLDGSRGPVVGALVATILIVFKHPTLRAFPKFAMFVTLGVLTALAYQISASTASRLGGATTSGRGELYRQTIAIAAGHPLGIGWGNFYRFAPAGLLGAGQGDNQYAHNIVLEFWIEAGVVGALAFSVFAITILVMALRGATGSATGLALAALLVSLLAGAMLSSDVIGNRMLWVVLGAVLATRGSTGISRAPRLGPLGSGGGSPPLGRRYGW
jgi:O-antigen ligase